MDSQTTAIFKWNELSRKTICKTPILNVDEIVSTSPQGVTGTYVLLDAFDWVITVPELDIQGKKHLLLVQQWRHGANSVSTEFPGGVINKGELPADAARRELEEETGYHAQTLTHLVSVNPNPAIMTNTVHIFAASSLIDTGEQHLDSDEFIHTLTLSTQDVFQKMCTGEFCHALMGTALLAYMQKFPLNTTDSANI